MAGTLFGLGLSQRVTLNGLPEAGWLLYVYDSGTSTPAATYSDTGLTTELSFPIEADSYGMLPDFWVADGTYRARATNSTGSAVFFDRDALLAIGPSSGSGGGGGGGGTVDINALFNTGDTVWLPQTGTRTSFVRSNGGTIGSVSSGGTERAAADTQPLFEYLWNNFTNTQCPVSGGRGGSATADFSADKRIGTLFMPAGIAASVSSSTWTPALKFGGASVGLTYTTQVGRYTKVNDLITIWATLIIANKGSSVGAATITGLPFAAATVMGAKFTGTPFTAYLTLDGFPGGGAYQTAIASGASSISIYQDDGTGNTTVVPDNTFFLNSSEFSFSLTYRTDANTDAGATGTWYMKL